MLFLIYTNNSPDSNTNNSQPKLLTNDTKIYMSVILWKYGRICLKSPCNWYIKFFKIFKMLKILPAYKARNFFSKLQMLQFYSEYVKHPGFERLWNHTQSIICPHWNHTKCHIMELVMDVSPIIWNVYGCKSHNMECLWMYGPIIKSYYDLQVP